MVEVIYLGAPVFPSVYYGYIDGERVELRVDVKKKISRKAFGFLRKKLGDKIILAEDLPNRKNKQTASESTDKDTDKTKKAKANVATDKSKGKTKKDASA